MSLKKLADLATKMDAEGKTKAASAIDAALVRLAEEGELINFPSFDEGMSQEDSGLSDLSPPLSDDIREFGEEGKLEALSGFVEALLGGAFETLEEAQDAAKHFSDEYGALTGGDEPMTDDVGLPEGPELEGNVLEFPEL
jgi:hypothetical protein